MKANGPSQNQIALTLFASAETVGAWGVFPSWYSVIREAAGEAIDTQQRLANLRAGYVPATAFSTIMAAAAAIAGKSWLPIIASLATSGVMLMSYEGALPPNLRLLSSSQPAEYALPMGV